MDAYENARQWPECALRELREQQSLHEERIAQMLEEHQRRVVDTLQTGLHHIALPEWKPVLTPSMKLPVGAAGGAFPEYHPSPRGPVDDEGLVAAGSSYSQSPGFSPTASTSGKDLAQLDSGSGASRSRMDLDARPRNSPSGAGRPGSVVMPKGRGRKVLFSRKASTCSQSSQESGITEGSTSYYNQNVLGPMENSMHDISELQRSSSYDIFHQGHAPIWSVRVLNSKLFENMVAALITLNAISIGYAADWRMKNLGRPLPLGFRVSDIGFIVAFGIELIVRMHAERRHFLWPYSRNFGWNVFDSLLVICASAEEVIGMFVKSAPNVSVVRLLRILRLVRVVRVFRVMRFFRELRLMVAGIMSCGKALTWAILLLVIIIYIYAVFLMQINSYLLEERPDDVTKDGFWNGRFGSMERTMYTLFKCMCGGINWGEVADPYWDINLAMGLSFALYIAFTVFCVLNILTACFVESATRIGGQDEDRIIMDRIETQQKWISRVKEIFMTGGKNNDASVNWEEFTKAILSKRNRMLLRELELDVDFANPRAIFSLFDVDGNGYIDLEEFAKGIHLLHGPARSLDVMRIKQDMKVVKQEVRTMRRLQQRRPTPLL